MTQTWVPVANESDLAPRHVFQGKLMGQELALWKADDGNVNVWENRCLHRGVRLSIGVNTGAELVCQYHGWRYANRNAGCTYIPAHPADAPARTICNKTYPVQVANGLVWTHLADTDPPLPAPFDGIALRPMPVAAPSELVAGALADFAPDGFAPVGTLEYRGPSGALRLYLQTADAAETVIRGVVASDEPAQALLRRLNAALRGLRDAVAAQAARMPAPDPFPPVYDPVPEDLARMPQPGSGAAGLRVRVAKKVAVGEGIVSLELEPLRGRLPACQPGAHIDVTLPGGLVRQYSLVNAPGETARYVIGVKREADSAGGSAAIHDNLREGDILAISEPRNNFTLRRDKARTLLVAGGIGVTPLLSMAAALADEGQDFDLHYFVASAGAAAFRDRLAALGDRLHLETGMDPGETRAALAGILASPGADAQVYICGPAPMLDAARAEAARAGWPDAAVHFEYFANPNTVDTSSSFTIELARSALTLEVPAGRSILSVLRDHDVAIASSCRQGACGTCLARVIEGEVDHQDVYLSAAERSAGDKILTCVSRARSDRLILDL